MRRSVRLGIAAVVAVVLVEGAGVASAAPPATRTPAPVRGGTITVTQLNDRASFSGVFDAGNGITEISDELGAPPGGGDSALVFKTPADKDKVQYANRALNGPLSGFFDLTYWARTGPPPEAPPAFQPQDPSYPVSGTHGAPGPDGQPAGPDGDHGPGGQWGPGPGPGDNPAPEEPRETPQPVPSFELVIDSTGGTLQPREVYVLTYYPDGVTDDWSQQNAGAGRYCMTLQIGRTVDAHRAGCPDSERRTLPEIVQQFPNASVLYAGVNQGGGNGGTTTGVDLIHAGDTTYNFEVGGPE